MSINSPVCKCMNREILNYLGTSITKKTRVKKDQLHTADLWMATIFSVPDLSVSPPILFCAFNSLSPCLPHFYCVCIIDFSMWSSLQVNLCKAISHYLDLNTLFVASVHC